MNCRILKNTLIYPTLWPNFKKKLMKKRVKVVKKESKIWSKTSNEIHKRKVEKIYNSLKNLNWNALRITVGLLTEHCKLKRHLRIGRKSYIMQILLKRRNR